MDYSVLDQEALDEIGVQMISNNEASLPFAAPLLYVVNGNGRTDLLQSGGLTPAQAYGGWAIDAAEAQSVVTRTNKPLPAYFQKGTASTKRSGLVEVWTARAVPVALVYARQSWLSTQPALRRSVKYFEGARRHVHALVILGERPNPKEAKISIWGPALLSAKGYQAKRLVDAFDEWSSATAAFRREVRPTGELPASLFWAVIGTFGPEFKQETVGKGANTSPITPIGCHMLPDVNQASMGALFGGEELAKALVDHGRDAKQWKENWAEFDPDDAAVGSYGNGQQGGGSSNFQDRQPYDDEIPF